MEFTVKRIYLDACCLGRLTDDQSQARIREEAEAIERLLGGVRQGKIALVSSEALEEEIIRNSSLERRIAAESIISTAEIRIEINEEIALRARELVSAGYGTFDALHLAVAEFASVDALLTTDDRLLRRAARALGSPRIPVKNPVSWVIELGT